MSDARPRVLAVLPGFFPGTIIGVATPLQRLHRAGRIDFDLTLQGLATRRQIARADVVVFCHSLDPGFAHLLAWVRELQKPLIHEIDDNLLEPPSDIPGLDYLREPARRALLVASLQQAALVRVYSPALQASLSALNNNVMTVSGPLEWSLLPDPMPPRTAGRVRMVYATSRQHDPIGELIVRPLARVLEEYPQAELTVWGPHLTALTHHPRVRTLPFVRDYEKFFVRFARERFDIGLAPLRDDAFHRCKSNNKFREYGACGVAGVYSDMSVYNTSVQDGLTGLLAANNEAAWGTAIGRLVADAGLRDRIAAAAAAETRRRYNEDVTDTEWMAPITQLSAASVGRAVAATARSDDDGTAAQSPAIFSQAGRLSTKAVRVIRQAGLAEAGRRAFNHLRSVSQLMAWKVGNRRVHHGAGGRPGPE